MFSMSFFSPFAWLMVVVLSMASMKVVSFEPRPLTLMPSDCVSSFDPLCSVGLSPGAGLLISTFWVLFKPLFIDVGL